MELVRPRDANDALDRVGEPLRAAGAEGELSLSILRRLSETPDAYGDAVALLIGERAGRPVAITSMTGPHPALIVGFGDAADVDYAGLAGAMLADGFRPDGVNGPVRWSEPFAHAWREAGAAIDVRRETRAFELHTVRPPRPPGGRMRSVTPADAELVTGWILAFGEDIAEDISPAAAAGMTKRLTDADDVVVWERDGVPVSMAGVSRRTDWSACVGLVYTPPALRGHGYASAVVAALSQRELDAGCGWCSLFTDLANPTSNHIYAELGYEPACDFRQYSLGW